MITLEQLAHRCDKVRWNGEDSFTACCVAHDDRNPSMSVTEKDGKILVYCFAGCPQEDLLDALGFTVNNNRFTTTRRPSPEKKQYISPTLDYAKQIWAAGNDDDAYVSEQGYCQKKRITHAFGARRGRVNGSRVGRDADCVLVPNRDWEGNLVGIEAINPDGVKQTYGHKGLLMLGHPEEASVVHICEGWATAWAIGHIFPRPYACIVAFGKSKMEQAYKDCRVRFRGNIVIHDEDSDNRDVWDRWDAGEGEQYAEHVGGLLI